MPNEVEHDALLAKWVDLEIAAADTLKRVIRPEPGLPGRSLDRILTFVETKTVWHTKALI